jgi:hypothetical protein
VTERYGGDQRPREPVDAVPGCGRSAGRVSWGDVARIYQRVLGRRVQVLGQPATVFAVGQRLLDPVAPSPAGVMTG